jgi:hypothetical protein
MLIEKKVTVNPTLCLALRGAFLHLLKKLPPHCSQNVHCITKNKIAKSIAALKKKRSATKLLLSKEVIIAKLLGSSSSSPRLRNKNLP